VGKGLGEADLYLRLVCDDLPLLHFCIGLTQTHKADGKIKEGKCILTINGSNSFAAGEQLVHLNGHRDQHMDYLPSQLRLPPSSLHQSEISQTV